MSDTSQLALVLTSLVSVIFLLIVIRLWASLRLDTFRQEMFTLRDEMFDYALNGNIPFSHSAHRLLRKSMNGFIRYAHNLTFYRLAVTMLQWRLVSQIPEIRWAGDWNRALESIRDEEVRVKMREFHDRCHDLVAKRVVLGSPILILLLVCIAVKHGVRSLTAGIAGSLGEFIDPRILEEEAARAAA